MAVNPHYNKVLSVYKTLYFMGREYPKGADWFHPRLHNAFVRNKNVEDPKLIEDLVKRAEFVVKELEALYSLRKYRALKERYYG
ncbi:Complex 1 LYR protein domain containing protein [Aphelenchoides fujianensis]|nr:Complex 1 LYR protein domain containing protein [Aphelenchoides fujianensis]